VKPLASGCAAVILTPRNVVAVVGFEWRELAPILAEKGVAVGHVGRRPFVFLEDVVSALAGMRARPWTEEDTRAELARSRKAGAK
jgi:hypothetical protein